MAGSTRFMRAMLTCCAITWISLNTQAAPSGQPMFADRVVQDVAPAPEALAVIRSRPVQINLDGVSKMRTASRMTLNFFENMSFPLIVTGWRQSDENTLHWEGIIEGFPDSSALLVLHQDALAGMVRVPGLGDFRVRSSAGRGQIVEEIDPARFLPCGTTHDHAVIADPARVLNARGGNDGPGCTIIDILVVYTPEARDFEGGTAAIQALANLAVDETNHAFSNSLVGTHARLVYVGEINYVESGSFSTELSRLKTPGDGFMDEVHALRDLYGADLVDLLVSHTQGNTICGIAYLMDFVSVGFEEWAFSVCNTSCSAGGFTFPHEVGHNMGCHHDRDNAGGGQGAFDFSYGYRFNGDDGVLYRTIMAYAPGNRISFFSNPNLTYQGQPIGLPQGHPEAADNALTLNLTAKTVSQFRLVPPDGSPPQPHVWNVDSMVQASDAAASVRFGNAVAIDGNLAIVGAWEHDRGGATTFNAGAAYIFRFDPKSNQWIEEQMLLQEMNEDEEAIFNDRFGISVAILDYGNGDGLAVIGASQDDNLAGRDAGAVYVFRKSGLTWNFEAKLVGESTANGDALGRSVAVTNTNGGELILASAFNNDELGPNAGIVRVFRNVSGAWLEEGELQRTTKTPGISDQFGSALAVKTSPVDGNTYAAVGAWNEEVLFQEQMILNAGAGYVFQYEPFSGVWFEVARLTAPDPMANDQLGNAIAIDASVEGRTVVVGAYSVDYQVLNSGAAYVFRDSGSGWLFDEKLTAGTPVQNDRFGWSVALSGNVALIGAPQDDTGSLTDNGSVYTFRRTASWAAESRMNAFNALASDQFGYSVALQGDTGVIGAWQRRLNATTLQAGAAYFSTGVPLDDCNQNGVADVCDLILGTSQDVNDNQIPDECEPTYCAPDITGDGTVNVADLLQVIQQWGNCPLPPNPCTADIAPLGPPTGDGIVNVGDLLAIIQSWGACP